MSSGDDQKSFLVSSGCQTSDKQIQALVGAEPVSPWLQTETLTPTRESTVSRTPRAIPVRSVSTLSFREPKDVLPMRAAPFPSIPSRREVQEIKTLVEQEIQRLRADLSSLQHERSTYNRNANHLLKTANANGIHEYRGLFITDNSINAIIAENKAKKDEAQKNRNLTEEIQLFKNHIEFPYYRETILAQQKSVLPIFAIQFGEKLELKNYRENLAEKYVKAVNAWVRPNQLIDEYGSRVDIKSDVFPPEFNVDTSKIDDAARLKWCAPDQEMIISYTVKIANCFYDLNGLVIDPEAAHNEYKSRLCWTNEEREIFLERYRQFPKDFRKITSSLPEKCHKDVIEYYYLKRYEFNLKQNEAAAKKRGGKRKVISEGSAKKNY